MKIEEKFLKKLGKLNAIEFIGVCSALKIDPFEPVTAEEKKEFTENLHRKIRQEEISENAPTPVIRDLSVLLPQVLEAFNKLNREERRALLKEMK